MTTYTIIEPQSQPKDGRYFINTADGRAEVDVYHIDHEIAEGRAVQVIRGAEIADETQIPNGALVSMTAHHAHLWTIA